MCTGGALEVTCETKEGAVENQPLTIPDDEASCPLAVDRRAVAISRGSVFHGQCTGGVIVPFAAATLDYGTSLHFGEVTCLSDQEAVICLDDASETGFTLSRAGYTAFGVGGS
jgi:hypothetical protein